MLARVRTHLQLKQMQDFLRDKNAFLETEVKRRTRDLLVVQDATIQVVAALAEGRVPRGGVAAVPPCQAWRSA